MPHRVEFVDGQKTKIIYDGSCRDAATRIAGHLVDRLALAVMVNSRECPKGSVLRLIRA